MNFTLMYISSALLVLTFKKIKHSRTCLIQYHLTRRQKNMTRNDCHDKYILMIVKNINVISNLRHISGPSEIIWSIDLNSK